MLPATVLQVMMGGGGAFSAGGPGKGMYSRLFRNVLNRYDWPVSANSFYSVYGDSGLFGLYGVSAPQNGEDMVNVLLHEALNMGEQISAEELSRAKQQLKSSIHMQLELRGTVLEDLGRQLLFLNELESPQQLAANIDKITEADIKRVAQKMLKSTPSVAAVGDTRYMPHYQRIKDAMQ